ncbi:cell division protein FtsH, partial [Chloroflexota bacterium]
GILEVHAKGKPMADGVSLEVIAKETPGFSGADLANIVNEAAILAARRDLTAIGLKEFEDAIDRIIAGPEKKSQIMSKKEKEITAYHEAGHALVGKMLPDADPVHKISIVARGMMGGYTRFLPVEDRHFWTTLQLDALLAVNMGGRTAEKVVFGDKSTGSAHDIEQATKIARKMVTEYGMSDKLGPRTFGRKEELVFLGREISEQRNYGDRMADEIDSEVNDIIDRAQLLAEKIITENRTKLNQIADMLMEKETIEGAELAALFAAPVSQQEEVAPSPQAQAS